MRALRLPSLVLPILLAAALFAPAVTTSAPAVQLASLADPQPVFPITATPFYAVQSPGASRVHPNKPQDPHDTELINRQVQEMLYAGQQAGMFSWFGRGSFPDQVFGSYLRGADDTAFRWAIYDEMEGPAGPNGGNPTVAQIRADLDHIYTAFGKDRNYLRVGGKPVIFVYSDANETCNAAARWRSADSTNRFYVVQRYVPHYTTCNPQPNGWHGYAPAAGHLQIGGSSYSVSPGYYAARDATPKLARSVSRFTTDLKAMKAARVQWKLTTTWNEWSEGTGVEQATEWATGSGHGAYVDAMHAVLGSAATTPPPPSVITAATNGESVNLSWSAVTGASYGYNIYRNGCLLRNVGTAYYTDSGIQDTSASYYVKALNSKGTGRRSNVVVGTSGLPVAAPASSGEGVVAVPGTRILSTVTGGGVGCAGRQSGQLLMKVPSSVPADATTVVLVLTAVSPFGNGTVHLGPAGAAVPPVSQLRYYSSRSSSTTTVVPIGTGRQIVLQQSGAPTHLCVDLLGYGRPGAGSLVASNAARFLDSRTGLGGIPIGKVRGTVTATLPSVVPADATAVQVRALVTGAVGSGSAIVFTGGTTKPAVTSLAYAPSVNLTGTVLVPVAAGRRISVDLSSSATVVLGIDGWVTPQGSHLLHAQSATRLLASTTRMTSAQVTLPLSAAGKTALVSVGVASALGYGNLSLYPDGGGAPIIQTLSYGPQQPQSGFMWVWVPANGKIDVKLSSGALLYVDLLGLA